MRHRRTTVAAAAVIVQHVPHRATLRLLRGTTRTLTLRLPPGVRSGGYKWGTKDTIYNMTEGGVYINDFIGLKELNEAGKIQFNSYAGQHVQFPQSFWDNVILPLFNN